MKRVIYLFIALSLCSELPAQEASQKNFEWKLKDGWNMQSSLSVSAKGAEVSSPDFKTDGWNKVNVPTTIIGGLLANHKYDFDPFYGQNLEKITGPEFDQTWWFRKEFTLPPSANDKTITLRLHGINYKANVWLNGVLIADSTEIKGPFRIFELDVTGHVNYHGKNVLALEILRPFNPNKRDGDLAIDYADWIHYPADYNGGIINDVDINACDKVAVRYPLVTTSFDLPSLKIAHLQVAAEIVNYSDSVQNVQVKGIINEQISFQQQVHLLPGETKDIKFSPADFPQLNIRNPHIWWPWQYGKQELNHIKIEVFRNHKLSNAVAQHFGIREVTSVFIDKDAREFLVNGKRIMLRGAAWSPDIFQRRSNEREEQQIKLVRDMHMNIIRSEGKLEDENFYDLCDKYGMLVMSGWMCCGTWQYPANWSSAERNVAMQSDRSVMLWLRSKACLLTWLNGSDMAPKDPTVESDYLSIEKDLDFPDPTVSSASADSSTVTGNSGVKMNGPYDWVPPVYWETDPHKYGGAWSFATEISPGPSIPPYESLIKFIPKDSLSTTNSDWLYHCGTMQFGNTKIFDSALTERYGVSSDFREYLAKAQAQNYEGHRAMMEAYGLNKYHTATGVVQWMLSNPWPSLIWHTYDYYLYPAGTYFGMKKSMETLHVQYSYKSKEVIILNSLLHPYQDMQVKATVYNLDGSVKYNHSMVASVGADSSKRCFVVPDNANFSKTYFLRLQLKNEDGKTQSINWYWLSQKPDSLNWGKSRWYYTPQSAFTDFSALQNLAPTTLKVNYTTDRETSTTFQTITVTNTGKTVAFFVHLRALKGITGDDILPVIFEDNYLLLAPGETRVIHCHYENKDAGGHKAYIQVSGWNIATSHCKTSSGVGFENTLLAK